MKNVGENNRLEKTCLEEAQTEVWLIFLVYFFSDITYYEIE